MASLSTALMRALFEADRRFGRGYRRVRDALGVSRPPRIVPYRGWAFADRATILARVLEDRGAPEWREGAPLRHTFEASIKRYATLEIPEALVEVRWAGRRWRERTDDEGHLTMLVTPPHEVRAGWSGVELSLPGAEARASAEVLVTDPRAEFAVVSDIDDTVIDTNVRHPLARVATLFLTDSRVRLPFAGVAALYRAFHREKNPLFYVSSSPWNLYEHLAVLFERHDVPKGPMLLRDWGISREGLAPLGGHAHKRTKIDRLVADHPGLAFVLIGDSGQHDARHYVAVAEHHRGRVPVIYIRDVGLRHRGELEGLVRRACRAGTELVVIDDSVSAAQHAAARGFIRGEDVAEVAADRRADALLPGPIEQVLEHRESAHGGGSGPVSVG